MLNRIVVVGRLTRDPEEKKTTTGVAVTTFTVACERNYAAQGQEKETDFIPVVTWRGLAETCGQYLGKGKLVAVDGRLQIRNYEAKDGSKRSIAEIVADNVQFLSPRSEGEPRKVAPVKELGETEPPDDIPF